MQQNMLIWLLRKVFMLTISGKESSNNCKHKTQWMIQMLILLILNILSNIQRIIKRWFLLNKMVFIKFLLAGVLNGHFKLTYVYLSEGISFANVIAVWNWWYKPIYELFFSQYILLKILHLNDSTDVFYWYMFVYWQAEILNKEITMKCIPLTLRIVTIENLQLIFLLIL